MTNRVGPTRFITAVSAYFTIATICVVGSAQIASPQAGEVCAAGDVQKTTICHVPPGHPEQARTECVANSAVKMHIANHPEDCAGQCPCAPAVTYSTCAPVTVSQLHGTGFVGNSRLARIENGNVPCLHVETGETAQCLFFTASEGASGEWVEAADGHYAKTGQAITREGGPGGDWVVAARVSDESTVPCVAPTGRDSAGTLSGMELFRSCAVETLLSASNVTGFELVNYATLEVCTSSNPHPDGATLTRTIPTDVGTLLYCYRGVGAALNDINGIERNVTGTYLTGSEHCHVMWSSGFEVEAAKRPATTSFPSPGSVKIDTPILWRPVNTKLRIANE